MHAVKALFRSLTHSAEIGDEEQALWQRRKSVLNAVLNYTKLSQCSVELNKTELNPKP